MAQHTKDTSDYELMCSLVGESVTQKIFSNFAGSSIYFPMRYYLPNHEEILSLRNSGLTINQIARAVRAPKTTIHRMLKEIDSDQAD